MTPGVFCLKTQQIRFLLLLSKTNISFVLVAPSTSPIMSMLNVSGNIDINKVFFNKKCLNDRRWITSQLERSSPEFKPECSLLDYYFVTESECRKSEAIASHFFLEQNVNDRLLHCSNYFKKIQSVAFDMVIIDYLHYKAILVSNLSFITMYTFGNK